MVTLTFRGLYSIKVVRSRKKRIMHTRIVNSFKLKPYDWLGATAAEGLRQGMRGVLEKDRYWATMLHLRHVPRSCQ